MFICTEEPHADRFQNQIMTRRNTIQVACVSAWTATHRVRWHCSKGTAFQTKIIHGGAST
jgi:hypothetical protein